MSRQATTRFQGISGGVLRCLLLCLTCAVVLLILCFSSAARAQVNNSPGNQYVFGADSPVASAHPAPQQSPAISGNIAVWTDQRPVRPGESWSRIFYRQLLNITDPPGTNTPDEQALSGETLNNQDSPAISGNLVVWNQMVSPPSGGLGTQIFYQYIGGAGPNVVLNGSYSQSQPAVSGTRVVWQDGDYFHSQIHMVDLNDGIDVPITSGPGTNLEPAIDGDWVVWMHNENYNYGSPSINILYAKNVVTGDLKTLDTGGNYRLEECPSISGSTVVWDENGGGNHNAYYFNLSDPQAQRQTVPGSDFAQDVKIDGNIIVWTKYTTNEIFVHDLSTGITQQVSSGPAAYRVFSAVSAGHIIWQDDRDGTRDIYQNKLGDRAQALADRYMPELILQGSPLPGVQYDNPPQPENFQPMPIEQFLTSPGTYLRKRWYSDPPYDPKLNPTVHDLATVASLPDMYVDLAGNSMDTGGGDLSATNRTVSINYDLLNRDYVVPYQQRRDQFPKTIYTRVVSRPGGNTNSFIQYWMFYYANDFPEEFHEGDWEVVQVDLGPDLQPYRADYSQHGYGQYRNWTGPGSVEKSPIDSNKPVVYVAKGSHANYFSSSTTREIYWSNGNAIPGVWDSAQGGGDVLNDPNNPDTSKKTTATVVPEADHSDGTPFKWLKFMGQWGEYTGANVGIWPAPVIGGHRDGPDNPPVQAYWANAFAWHDNNCDGCKDDQALGTDTEVTAKSPVDISLYDSQGRHTGKNASGGIDQQIPGSEYLEYPGLHRKSIIIHGSDINPGYRFEATGNGTGPADFIVTAPDHTGGSVDTLNYNAVQVSPSTKVTMNLDAAKNYSAAIDVNGDGTNVIQKAPDTTITNSVDFTPPAQVSNLAVTSPTSGSANITFTAPGDDGNTGTAAAYDLRYSTSAITDQDWKDAIPAGSLPTPLAAGSTQTITVSGLDPGITYYFALKTMDKAGLFSSLSNVASATTTIPQLTWAKKKIYWASWADYQNRQLSLDYKIGNSGTEIAIAATIAASYGNPTSVYVTTPLPLTVGDISPNSASTITLKYYVPTSVGGFTTTTYASCQDDAGRTYWFPGPMP
ncbi:MAG: hypothetical protein ACYC5F_05060 [Thermoleophilia bacterium]